MIKNNHFEDMLKKVGIVLCTELLPILLTSCATIQPLPTLPKQVTIPVSVPCVKGLPLKPSFATHDYLKLLSVTDYPLIITAELLKYENYTSELESVLIACKQ